jgi:hypothetical protein
MDEMTSVKINTKFYMDYLHFSSQLVLIVCVYVRLQFNPKNKER